MFQNKAVVECNSQIFMTTFILFTLFLVRDCPHFSLTQNLPKHVFWVIIKFLWHEFYVFRIAFAERERERERAYNDYAYVKRSRCKDGIEFNTLNREKTQRKQTEEKLVCSKIR